MTKKISNSSLFNYQWVELKKAQERFSTLLENVIRDLIKENSKGIDIDFSEKEISHAIYELMEQHTAAELADFEYLESKCKEIAQEYIQPIIDRHNNPCCGGSGCIDCLCGGWSNFI